MKLNKYKGKVILGEKRKERERIFQILVLLCFKTLVSSSY